MEQFMNIGGGGVLIIEKLDLYGWRIELYEAK